MLGDTILDTPGMKEMSDFASLVFANFRLRGDRLPIFSGALLRKLGMPVLAIVGGKDVLLSSRETRRRLEANIKMADVRFLPDTGHLIRGQTETVCAFLLR